MGIVLLIVALVLVITVYVIIQRAGGVSFPWLQFYVRGKESGFSFSEVNLLRQVAVQNKLKTPTSLFWSVRTLDRCIRSAIVRFRSTGTENSPQTLEFLGKLFEFRKRVEFNQPKYKLGLTSSRGMTASQTLKITVPAVGVYVSKLVENNRRYMALSYPQGNDLPPGFSWKDQILKIYFWRAEDAGYYFEAKVLGDFLDRKVPILHIAHSDSLVRTQKRKSVRRIANSPATLVPLTAMRQANENVESSGGYRCKLVDLSEDGAAIAIGGRAKAGQSVKIQAELDKQFIVINGVVKSVNFKEKNRASILHIQAEPPSLHMKIRILSYVYQLFNDNENVTELKKQKEPKPEAAKSAKEPRKRKPDPDSRTED